MSEPENLKVDRWSVWDLREVIPEKKLTLPEECYLILDECADFIAWGVLNQLVIVLTSSARILFTAKTEYGPDMVKVEYFPNWLSSEETTHRKTFALHKKYLQETKHKLLEDPNRQTDFSEIAHGQYYG